MSTDKTLADVQPGGMVRLGDRQFEAWALSTGRTINDLRKLEGEYVYEDTRLMCAAWQAALSAQPSPASQGDDSPMAKMAAALRGKAEAERAAFDQRVQSGEWGPMPDNPDVLELPPLPEEVDSVRCMIRGEKGFAEPCDYYFTSKQMRDYARTALAARQPVGEPVFRERSTHKVYRGSCGSLPCHCWADTDHIIGDEVKRYAAPPAQAVDLNTVRYALDSAEGLAVACASVDGFSREELASAGREMRKQFADARVLIDSQVVGK